MPRVNTSAERLRHAMTLRGIDARPAALVALMRQHGHNISRQLARLWMQTGSQSMRPRHLWALADALDVSARWLAAIDDSAMLKPTNLTSAEERTILALRQAPAKERAALVRRIIAAGRR